MLAGCSAGKDVPAATAAAGQFHRLLDAGRIDQIDAMLAPEFRQAGGPIAPEQLFGAVHRKLGPVVSAEQSGWNDQFDTSGHFITLGYRTRFKGGEADEQFVWKDAGGRMQLAGYHVNSAALPMN